MDNPFSEDKAKREAQEKLIELKDKQVRDDYKKILETPEGMRTFQRLLAKGSVFNTTFRSDDRQQVFEEGKRAFALWMLSEMEIAAPHKLCELLLKESK